MGVPSTTAEAMRATLIAQGFSPSTEIESFDSQNPGALHRQFFLVGPRLTDTRDVSQQVHQQWEMSVQIAWAPTRQGDVDRFRFDLADAIAALHQAWSTNTTILADEFKVLSSDPEFNPETQVWEVLVTGQWWVSRSVSA